MSNDFESFAELPEALQVEALREGERRLEAQLQVATAADQRALTWGGLLVAAVTGSLAGGVALIAKAQPDYWLGGIAFGFAALMLGSAWHALSTVEPGEFCLPGNEPRSWLPGQWNCVGSDRLKLAQARKDQAEHLSKHIVENRASAKAKAQVMKRSFRIARWSIATAAAVLAGELAFRLIA